LCLCFRLLWNSISPPSFSLMSPLLPLTPHTDGPPPRTAQNLFYPSCSPVCPGRRDFFVSGLPVSCSSCLSPNFFPHLVPTAEGPHWGFVPPTDSCFDPPTLNQFAASQPSFVLLRWSVGKNVSILLPNSLLFFRFRPTSTVVFPPRSISLLLLELGAFHPCTIWVCLPFLFRFTLPLFPLLAPPLPFPLLFPPSEREALRC